MQNKCLWLIGLSGAGKTTIATELVNKIKSQNEKCILLDGDVLRTGLNNNLGFEKKDRFENVRRTAELAKLFLKEGYYVVVALITPFEEMRTINRSILGLNYIEVFINTSLEICQKRDPKGLYAKVANNEISNFTGIDSPFEIPSNPDLEITTENVEIETNALQILDFVFHKNSK